jgi:hypothetical protein
MNEYGLGLSTIMDFGIGTGLVLVYIHIYIYIYGMKLIKKVTYVAYETE